MGMLCKNCLTSRRGSRMGYGIEDICLAHILCGISGIMKSK